MAINDACFQGDIPAAYDRYMVPILFDPYAADLAQRLASVQPHRVLEVAAGSGALTRAISSALPHAEIIATDLNQAMLDVAARRHSGGHVVWRQADALSLPFPDQTFDAVTSQFGVMFFPDKHRAYHEILRVLKPPSRAEAERNVSLQHVGHGREQRFRSRRQGCNRRRVSGRSAGILSTDAAWLF